MSNRKKISIGQIEALGAEGQNIQIEAEELVWFYESKKINDLYDFLDASQTEIIRYSTDFKITTLDNTIDVGVIATLTLADGITPYVLGDTVLKDSYLLLSVDVVGRVKLTGTEL